VGHSKAKLAIALAIMLTAAGCASRSYTEVSFSPQKPRRGGVESRKSTAASARPAPAAAPAGAGDAIALVGSRTIEFSQLRPLLIEAAGGDVLRELVLDEQITRELEKRKLTVDESDVQREREWMLSQLSDDPDQARRLLDELLRRRGMGPRRFALSLRQSAGLRKLVAGQVTVTDAMVRLAYERRSTPQSVCRLILVPSLREATEVLRRIAAGEPFIDLAVARSQDESRNQGGLLPPIAPYDTSFPSAVTATVGKLQVGQVSDPVALDNGFAIFKCERKITPESASFERVADELREGLRLGLERSAMDRQARLLLRQADVTVLDADLDREFKARRQQAVEP